MNYCAHIFVGKEFTTLVPIVSDQILRTGGEIASCVKLYVLEDNKVVEYQSTIQSEVDIIKGKLQSEPRELGTLDLTDVNLAAQWLQNNIYDQIVYNGNADSLHIQIHFPFLQAESLTTVIALYDAFNAGDLGLKNKTIEFVGYAEDICRLISSNPTTSVAPQIQVEAFRQFKSLRNLGSSPYLILFQNDNIRGLSLRLDLNALAEVIATYAVTVVEQYDTLFFDNREYRDVLAFGLMRLSLDKYRFVEYLMHKAFLGSLDQVELNQDEVDVNSALKVANNVVCDKRKLLSSIYEIIDSKVGRDEEILQYQKSLEKSVEDIFDKLKEQLEYNKCITLKAAILAALLNKTDCELFSNTIFDNQLANINDLYDESISYFVKNNIDDFYQIDEEPIVNPIAELKEVTSKLINAQTQVKFLKMQLSDLEENIESATQVEDCYVEDGNFIFHGQHFRLLPRVEQEPLAETYEAHDNFPESVDLKQFFSNVKNQGDQGSCLAHAVTSIFEYAMRRSAQKEVDLSEAFLYYNARKLDQEDDVSVQADTGSRYKPAMDSLVKYGIALERLCPYSDQVYTQEPSAEAYADAATRKLLVAKNVNRNIDDIKSALADGYPVAGSFGLMNSFFNVTDGYIPMPTEEEIKADEGDNKHSNHAMVIVGYSDALRMFVVRNSWGVEWGDKGYCYLPYEYVENKALCNFCCIITEIEHLDMPKLVVVPALTVDDTELKIRYLMASAALKNELLDVNKYLKQRDALLLYLEHEKKLLSAPNLKNDFIKNTTQKVQTEIDEFAKNLKDKEVALDELAETFRKGKIKFWIFSSSVVLGCIILFFAINYFLNYLKSLLDASGSWKLPWWTLVVALVVTCAVFGIKAHKEYKAWKEQRDDLTRDKNHLENALKDKKLYNEKLTIRTNAAWALIQALQRNESQIHSMYTHLISLINNLRVWYAESIQFIKDCHQPAEPHVPILTLLDYTAMDTFYQNEMKGKANFSIDFLDKIENHTIDPNYLKEYKDQLLSRLINEVFELPALSQFDISAHVAAPEGNAIGLRVTRDTWAELFKMADVFLHVNVRDGIIIPICNIFMPSLPNYQNMISRQLGAYNVQLGASSLKYDMIMVKSISVNYNECVMLN